eukprot:1157583-Pelagomonas_calceolata.AAC.10
MAATSPRQASPAPTASPTLPAAASAASCPGCTSFLPARKLDGEQLHPNCLWRRWCLDHRDIIHII